MSNPLQRWFERTRVRVTPIATNGREIAFGDGYSLLELERAGLLESDARALGLAVDPTRTSALGSNVIQLEKLRRERGV